LSFIQHLNNIIPISKELEAELSSVSKEISVAKNTILVSERERCRNLYFIQKGLVRGYYYDESKEITHWFAQEEEFATSFYSFITVEASSETIETLEDCKLIQISYSDLQNIYKKFPETERIGRIITETYYIKLEERFLTQRIRSAKDRYLDLLKKDPALLNRAALGQIATYLGIAQETLSRVRAEM
jgi:CRP-like cAMP-binding protein